MRKIALIVGFALAVCVVALPALASDPASHKTHDMTVEFVSFDAKAKTVTFKDDKGESKTAPVMEPAMKAFEMMKAGDKVTITCADDEKGMHKGVSMVKPAAKKA
jgi:hypothetical protein